MPMTFSKILPLYILAALSVLTAACGGEESETDSAVRVDSVSSEREDVDVDSVAGGEGVILFLGNSLSAGYGIDPEEAFPSLIEQKIDSLGWNFDVVNAGLSGETTAGGLRRIDWLLRQPIDVLVLELGGNDGLRGVPTEVTRDNLESIIEKTRQRYPEAEIVLAGMQIPPNLGQEYTQRFRDIYPQLAEQHDVHLVPFLLDRVGGVARLMQSDGIHPTEEGHRILAENVWEVLRPVLMDRIKPS